MPTLCRRFHFADDQRRDIDAYSIETVSLRRRSTARYRCLGLLYIDGFTSPMINGEISMPTLYRRFHFADDQRRDIDAYSIETVSRRRRSTARYRCLGLLYIDGFTSPMINGEISMPTLYRRFHFADDQRRDMRPSLYRRCHFADDQRRDIAFFFIQTVSLRR